MYRQIGYQGYEHLKTLKVGDVVFYGCRHGKVTTIYARVKVIEPMNEGRTRVEIVEVLSRACIFVPGETLGLLPNDIFEQQ